MKVMTNLNSVNASTLHFEETTQTLEDPNFDDISNAINEAMSWYEDVRKSPSIL